MRSFAGIRTTLRRLPRDRTKDRILMPSCSETARLLQIGMNLPDVQEKSFRHFAQMTLWLKNLLPGCGDL